MRNVSDANESHLNVYSSSTGEEGNQGQGAHDIPSQPEWHANLSLRIKRSIKRDNVQIRSAPSSEQTNLLPNTIHGVDRPVSPNARPSGQGDASAPEIAQSWGNEGLQQVGILSREAQFGKFSLENILSVPDVLKARPAPTKLPIHGADNFNDPITCNMLSFPVALGLFDR